MNHCIFYNHYQMSSNMCHIHKALKDCVFCLEDLCNDRLACQSCFNRLDKHKDHKFCLIQPFLNNDPTEMKIAFSKNVIDMLAYNKEPECIIEDLFKSIDSTMEERQNIQLKNMDTAFSRERSIVEQWKSDLRDKFGTMNFKGITSIQKDLKDLVNVDNSLPKQNELMKSIKSLNDVLFITDALNKVIV